MAETDPTISNPITDPTEPDWFVPLLGDDPAPERLEAMKAFETPQAFFDKHDELTNANWRDQFAGDDDKFKSTLERYASAEDLGKAFREQKATISAGGHKQAPGEDATPEDISAYREANGIPAEAAGYFENLPEGLVIGDEDKEIFGDFAGAMHDMNVEPGVMHKVIDWYNGFAQEQQDHLAEIDHEHHTETEDALRTEWGTDYRANINLVGAFLEATFGEDARDAILNARDMEGRALMNIPAVVQGLADISRRTNPIAQIVKPGGDPVETLNSEIDKIEAFMRSDRPAYNKDEKMQARYRELLQIRIDHGERKAG